MKKLLLLSLALALALCLAACGVKDAVQDAVRDAVDGGDSAGQAGGEQKDASGAFAQLEEWARAQGWDENPYGNWIVGVWDSDVLPACVPAEIEGVKADQTTYKEKRHDTYTGSYEVGRVSFGDQYYEEWGLSFYCTDGQLEQFANEMAAAGFAGGYYDYSYYPEYHWCGNGYYAFMQVNTELLGEEEYDNLAVFSITPDDKNPRPTTFKGTRLPDFGVVTRDYSEGTGFGYESDDESVDNFWNPITDSGALPAQAWSLSLEYFGGTEQQARDYVQGMAGQGWGIAYEHGEDGYTCQLEKDGMVAGVRWSDYTCTVGFANMGEMLWY